MTKSFEEPKPARKYQKIDKEQRKLVLKMLLSDKLSLQEVANRLSLKYCTVRTIQKAYEKEGRIGKKETRKRKLKVENILKIFIVNPMTLQLSAPIVSSEVSQIYIDKQPTADDQVTLLQEQRQLLHSQCHHLFQMLSLECSKAASVPNPYYQSTLQNLHLAAQFLFKQLFDLKQVTVKQEHEPVSPALTQYPIQFQPLPYQQQFATVYSRLRT